MPDEVRHVRYRLRVWRLERDGAGQWWGAWLLSGYSGHDYHLGDLRVPTDHRTISSVDNFSEYFGSQKKCDKVPVSIAAFTQPAANYHGDDTGVYSYYSHYRGWDKLNCTGASAAARDWGDTQGVQLTLGGR
jgi:hypothetical protein